MQRLVLFVMATVGGMACGDDGSRVLLRLTTDVPAGLRATVRVAAAGDTASACEGTAAAPAYLLRQDLLLQAGTPVDLPVTVRSGERVRVGVCVMRGTDVPWERVATFAYVAAQDYLLPLNLNGACLQVVMNCVSPAPCPYAQYCTEHGQTCVDNGACGETAARLYPYTAP